MTKNNNKMFHIAIRFIGSFADSSKCERIDLSGPLTVNALRFSDTGLHTGALLTIIQASDPSEPLQHT